MELKNFRAFALERFLLRKDEGSKRMDLFYHLVRDYEPHRLVILGLFLNFARLTKLVSRNNRFPLQSYSRMPLSLSLQVGEQRPLHTTWHR